MFQVAVLLGLVEGLTEFLPVSSTGHLILVGHWVGFTGNAAATFEVVIQLGAILAVVVEYRMRLLAHVLMLGRDKTSRRFFGNIVLAFVPAAVLGFLFHDAIKGQLFTPRVVAWALIVGAIAILVVEMLKLRARTTQVENMTLLQALGVGVAQCAALVPGASRAAATILGGLVVGLDRPTAAQFSFLLAIPTMLGATALDLLKNYHGLTGGDWARIGVGFVVSFLSAWVAVRWFLRYVSHHSLSLFAVYRLALGVVVLVLLGR